MGISQDQYCPSAKHKDLLRPTRRRATSFETDGTALDDTRSTPGLELHRRICLTRLRARGPGSRLPREERKVWSWTARVRSLLANAMPQIVVYERTAVTGHSTRDSFRMLAAALLIYAVAIICAPPLPCKGVFFGHARICASSADFPQNFRSSTAGNRSYIDNRRCMSAGGIRRPRSVVATQ